MFPSAGISSPPQNPVEPPFSPAMQFAREYKTLDCARCDKVLAFRVRATGEYLCDPTVCLGKGHDSVSLVSSAPTRSTHSSGATVKLEVVEPCSCDKDKEKLPPPPQEVAVASPPAPRSLSPIEYEPYDNMTQDPYPPSSKEERSSPRDELDQGISFNPLPPPPEVKPSPTPLPNGRGRGRGSISCIRSCPTSPVGFGVNELAPEPPRRYLWKEAKYSPNLVDNATIKTSFLWTHHSLQIIADKDENDLLSFQDKIAEVIKTGAPLSRPPLLDEILLAPYATEGLDYYRGRVTQLLEKDSCRVTFVDLGDAITLKHKQLYEITPELAEVPIYSARVRLFGVKSMEKRVRLGKKLNDLIYTPLQLQTIDDIHMGDNDEFKVILWTGDEETLNELISETLTQLEAEARAT